VDIAGVAKELYLLVPGEFTAARNARAKQTSDRELAAAIRALPRATASAWAVNQIAAQGADVEKAFADLGGELRAAQDRADRAELTRLSGQRRSLLADTAKSAASAAHEQGVALSASATEEIQQSLQAALADENGFAAVFSGRLVRAIRSDGLEPTDLSGAIGGPDVMVAPRKRASTAKGAAHTAPRRPSAAAEKKRRAALESAERAAREADETAAGIDDSIAAVESQQSDVADEFQELRTQLDDLATRQKDLETRAKQLARDRTRAREAARRAHRAVDEAGR
jgi:hypothetical protein